MPKRHPHSEYRVEPEVYIKFSVSEEKSIQTENKLKNHPRKRLSHRAPFFHSVCRCAAALSPRRGLWIGRLGFLTPDASRRLAQAGGLRAPDAVATAPAAGRGEGGGGSLRSRVRGTSRGAGGTSTDGSNRLGRLGSWHLLARGGATRGRVVGTGGGLAHSRLESALVVRSVRLGAGSAASTRALLARRTSDGTGAVSDRDGCVGITVRRGTAGDVVRQGRLAPQTRRTTVSRHARTHGASLVDVASLLGKLALAVQGAPLPSDKLASLLLGHGLVAVGDVRNDSCAHVVVSLKSSQVPMSYVKGWDRKVFQGDISRQ